MTAIVTDFGAIHNMTPGTPLARSTKVNEHCSEIQANRDALYAWFVAEHTWCSDTGSLLTTLDLQDFDEVTQAINIAINIGAANKNINDLTNHVDGQIVRLLNLGTGSITVVYNTSFIITSIADDIVLSQYEGIVLKDRDGIWYEVANAQTT